MSMIPTTGTNFKKNPWVRVTCPGWLNMELPNEEFFPLSNLAMITVKLFFTDFHSNICQGNIVLHQNHASYSLKYNWENGVKQIEITEENLSISCILCQLLRTKTLVSGSKCIKHFFYFYHYLPYIFWVDVIYLTCLVFLKSPWWLVWIYCASTLLT